MTPSRCRRLPARVPMPRRGAPRQNSADRARRSSSIAFVVLVCAAQGHENKYERIAHELTDAVQNNDFAGVTKLENRRRPPTRRTAGSGPPTDALAPLGKIRRVHETPRRATPTACTSSTSRSSTARCTRRSSSTRRTRSFGSRTTRPTKRRNAVLAAIRRVVRRRARRGRTVARRRPPHAGSDVAHARRTHRCARLLESREPAAHRRVQVSRRVQPRSRS